LVRSLIVVLNWFKINVDSKIKDVLKPV